MLARQHPTASTPAPHRSAVYGIRDLHSHDSYSRDLPNRGWACLPGGERKSHTLHLCGIVEMARTTIIRPRVDKKTIIITVAPLALAACGSTPTKSSTGAKARKSTKSSTMTKATAAATFKADIGPLNTAIAAMGTQAGTWTNSTPASVANATINPAVAALAKAETEFNQLAIQYPAASLALHNLTTAMSSLAGVLLSATHQNLLGVSSWVTQLAQTAETTHNDSNIVRSELGLPPAS